MTSVPGPTVNLGPWEPLGSLADEFRFNTNFGEKVQRLERRGYTGWRRIRGDGNCFYRALGLGLLEQLTASGLGPKRLDWLAQFRGKLCDVLFEDLAERSAHADLLACLGGSASASNGGTPGTFGQSSIGHASEAAFNSEAEAVAALCAMCRNMRDPGSSVDLALVRALRRMTSDYLMANKDDDDIGGGISFEIICSAQGYAGVRDFCERVVLPMGVEAESVVISALPPAIGAALRIIFLDRAESKDLTVCDYPEGIADDLEDACCQRPIIHMQLRPGHYDLLYFRNFRGAEVSSQAQPLDR